VAPLCLFFRITNIKTEPLYDTNRKKKVNNDHDCFNWSWRRVLLSLTLNRRKALTRHCADGQLEIDNLPVDWHRKG
jgi:hypothetical protein